VKFASSGLDIEKERVIIDEMFRDFIKAIKETSNKYLLSISAITLWFTVRRWTVVEDETEAPLSFMDEELFLTLEEVSKFSLALEGKVDPPPRTEIRLSYFNPAQTNPSPPSSSPPTPPSHSPFPPD